MLLSGIALTQEAPESIQMKLFGKENTYSISEHTLGTGTFSTVKLGYIIKSTSQTISTTTPTRVAIKIVAKKLLTPRKRLVALQKEIEILKLLGRDSSPFVKLLDVMEDINNIYLVFDCKMGDLHSYMLRVGKLSETQVMKLFPQIIEAVETCHVNGIVHRDLKLENILYSSTASTTESGEEEIKLFLADFGFATYFSEDIPKKHKKWCGSPFTVAPEILSRKPYEPQPVDVWSLGSLLFTLLCGYPPFRARTMEGTFRRTKKGKIRKFHSDVGHCVKDLIKKMLTVQPEKRMTLEQVKDHPWLKLANGMRRVSLPTVVENMTARRQITSKVIAAAPIPIAIRRRKEILPKRSSSVTTYKA